MKKECLDELNNLINEYGNDNEVLEIIYKSSFQIYKKCVKKS